MRHRWEDNIKMNFKEIGWEALKRLHVPLDRGGMRDPLKTVLHIQVAQNAWVFSRLAEELRSTMKDTALGRVIVTGL
jgi:hypothetical protein